MKAVLDGGQYVSATIKPRGHPVQIPQAWRDGKFELISSVPLLDDLRRVLFYLHIRKWHKSSDRHLTRRDSFEGVPIVLPRRFLEILDEQKLTSWK